MDYIFFYSNTNETLDNILCKIYTDFINNSIPDFINQNE